MPMFSIAVMLLLAASRPVAAQAPERPVLAAACRACHGAEGISASADIPNLAAIAGQLREVDIQALASYWSQLPGAAVGATAAVAPIRSQMIFPARFPQGFTLYETNGEQEGQVVLRYANAVALAAARDGKALPDGATIVVVNHAVQLDASGKPALDGAGHPLAGKVLSFAAMQARAGWGAQVPELLRNGDWDYALFSADQQRREGTNQALCLACHKPVAADSFVFTMKALRAAAH
jgi:cytochrome c553